MPSPPAHGAGEFRRPGGTAGSCGAAAGGTRAAPRPQAEPPRLLGAGCGASPSPLHAGGGRGRRSPSPPAGPAVFESGNLPFPGSLLCFVIASNTLSPPPLFFGVVSCSGLGLLLGFRQHPLPALGELSSLVFFRTKLKDYPGSIQAAFLLSLPKQLPFKVPPADLSLAVPAQLRNFCPRLRWPFICNIFLGVFVLFRFVFCHSSIPAVRNDRYAPARRPRGTAGTTAGRARTLRRAAPPLPPCLRRERL